MPYCSRRQTYWRHTQQSSIRPIYARVPQEVSQETSKGASFLQACDSFPNLVFSARGCFPKPSDVSLKFLNWLANHFQRIKHLNNFGGGGPNCNPSPLKGVGRSGEFLPKWQLGQSLNAGGEKLKAKFFEVKIDTKASLYRYATILGRTQEGRWPVNETATAQAENVVITVRAKKDEKRKLRKGTKRYLIDRLLTENAPRTKILLQITSL